MPDEESTDGQNASSRRVPNKRKREVPASRTAGRSSKNSTPNAYARRTPPPDPDANEDDEDGERSPPLKLKRPGGRSRFTTSAGEIVEQQRKQREEDARKASLMNMTPAERVAQHYNTVPERGRDWRKTDSKIKGLRSLNNWVKSTLIQKFSRPDLPVPDLRVLDMACGKGGDLGKWEKAPQTPRIYVGCDIASVSIDQARQRYAESRRKGHGRFSRAPPMQAEFYVHDAFGRPLTDVPAVRSIGYNPNTGPGPGIIQGGMMTGGFDVVSMMFALHYSFENESLARGMLKNVAGALKKGGRFIGVMPNSDVISSTIKRLLLLENAGKTPNGIVTPALKTVGSVEKSQKEDADDDWNPERPSEPTNDEDDDWDPEKPSEPQPTIADGEAAGDDDDDDWDPEKPSEPQPTITSGEAAEDKGENNTNPGNSEAARVENDDCLAPWEKPPKPAAASSAAEALPAADAGAPAAAEDTNQPALAWGNSIYNVRFNRDQPLTKKPLPHDGIFRPPFGWRYHYSLEEAVDVPEYVVPWEAFRALAEDFGLELMYRKGFREVFEDESGDRDLGILAERMGVMSRDRSLPNGGLLVSEEEMEAASFYHAFCFYKT